MARVARQVSPAVEMFDFVFAHINSLFVQFYLHDNLQPYYCLFLCFVVNILHLKSNHLTGGVNRLTFFV